MKNKIIFLLFIVSLAGFYLMNHFTGIAIDDFAYKFIFSEGGPSNQRVETIGNLFESLYNHYYTTNGRILLNGLAQVFLISDNKFWFDLLNTLFFGALQIQFYLYLKSQNVFITIRVYLLFLITFWFLIPGPNHTLFWLDGSINYLWASVIVLAFYLLHEKLSILQKNVSFWWYPSLFVVGFLSGATHEVLALGLSAALFFYYIFNKEKIKISNIPLVIGFFIGTAFLTFAPGNFVRLNAGVASDSSLMMILIQRLAGLFLSIPSLSVFIILLVVLFFLRFKRQLIFKEILQGNKIILNSIFFSLAFILIAGAYEKRVFFGITIFSLIILFVIIIKYFYWLNTPAMKWIIIIFSFFMLAEYGYALKDLRYNKIIFDNDEIAYRQSDDNVFEFREKKMNRFVSNGLGQQDQFFWSNIVMAQYYGKSYLIFLPSDLYSQVFLSDSLLNTESIGLNSEKQNTNTKENNIFLATDSGYLVIPVNDTLSKEIVRGSIVKFTPIMVIVKTKLSIKEKVLKSLFNKPIAEINSESTSCYLLETKRGNYIYFKKPSLFSIKETKGIEVFMGETSKKPVLDFKLQ